MSSVRVLIADDQYVTRTGLTAMVQSSPDLSVAGQAYDAEGTIKATAELTPDVVLVNLRRLQPDDLQGLIDQISAASSVIVLHSRGSHVDVDRALQAEVAGFADLDALEGQLANLVYLVQRGYSVYIIAREAFPPAGLNSHFTATFCPPWISTLTARETEVLQLIAGGMTNKQIAAKLHVAESTVKKHSCRVMKKMGVSSRVEAALQFAHYTDVITQAPRTKHRDAGFGTSPGTRSH
jgi:DNA-binding NarL/FixJ family response regulator